MSGINGSKNLVTIDLHPNQDRFYAIDKNDKRITTTSQGPRFVIEQIIIHLNELSPKEKQTGIIKLHIATTPNPSPNIDGHGWKRISIDYKKEIKKIWQAQIGQLQHLTLSDPVQQLKKNLSTTLLNEYKSHVQTVQQRYKLLGKAIKTEILQNRELPPPPNRSFAVLHESIPLYCDVTFLIEEEEIKIHKEVFTSQSPFFKQLLDPNSGFKESQQTTPIPLPEISLLAFEIIVKFLYTARIHIEEQDEIIEELYALAEHCQLDGLKKYCMPYFIQKKLSEVEQLDNTVKSVEKTLNALYLNPENQEEDMLRAYKTEIKKIQDSMKLFENYLQQRPQSPAKQA